MTRTEASEIISGLKKGVTYGVFSNADSQTTYWSIRSYDGIRIYVGYYGGYSIPCNEDFLLYWFGREMRKGLCLKPVIWDEKKAIYAAS